METTQTRLILVCPYLGFVSGGVILSHRMLTLKNLLFHMHVNGTDSGCFWACFARPKNYNFVSTRQIQ